MRATSARMSLNQPAPKLGFEAESGASPAHSRPELLSTKARMRKTSAQSKKNFHRKKILSKKLPCPYPAPGHALLAAQNPAKRQNLQKILVFGQIFRGSAFQNTKMYPGFCCIYHRMHLVFLLVFWPFFDQKKLPLCGAETVLGGTFSPFCGNEICLGRMLLL